MIMKKVEVFILSGFLGSGKTTLLTNILNQEKVLKRKIAVVMNELGKVSIDSNAISPDTPLKELLNGCVCCTIQGQLEAHMQGLLSEHDLDAIYIETTGVAHPVEVLDACMSPLFADKLIVRSITTLVDANRWQDRHRFSIQMQKLLQEQVRHADVILINKMDQLTEQQQASIVYEIQSINPSAKCLLTQFANVSLKDLLHSTHKKQSHQQTHVHRDLHIKTFVYTFKHPIDQTLFEEFLRQMPDTIYRIKGYISFTHSDFPYLFQYSYGLPLYMKEMIQYPNTLVFIGENLDHYWLEKELHTIEQQAQIN
jgi:G3E family GTPase